MEISILGWSYKNIRRFGNLRIDLSPNLTVPPKVSLIMMRNGTGKTTTIHLIRAVLNGSATSWTPRQIGEFKPHNLDISEGEFSLIVRFGNDIYRYSLIFDYDNGTAKYLTSRVSNTGGGQEEGRILPSTLNGVFDVEQFVNRFIFDGEQARKTLSSSSAEAENAVKYLYRVDRLEDLKRRINIIVNRKQAEGARGATAQSVKNNKTRMENKERAYQELVNKLERVNGEIITLEDRKERCKSRKAELLLSDDRIKQQVEQLKEKQAERQSDLVGFFATIKARMREPYRVNHVFDELLQDLANNMQTLKLPKTTAREFFRELSTKSRCICGRPIGEAERQSILANAEEYLGEEDLVAINAIKDRIRNYQMSDDLQNAIQEMCHAKDDLEDIASTMQRLQLQLNRDAQAEAEAIDAELGTIERDLEEKKKTRELLNANASTPGATEQNCIAIAKKAYQEAKDNYNVALGTYEFTKKAEKLATYLDDIRTNTLKKIKNTIIKKTNEKVAQILTDEQIVVERIDGNLVLQGRSGASEGQTLAIAYAYICSLFEHSSFDFPFVVDSPAASMDLDVRREVAAVIPQLFKQLVIFVTSGEVAGFVEKMYLLDNVSYFTVEGEHDGQPAKCTLGQEYFSAYQSEEDE